MSALELKELKRWKRPSDYAGATFEDYYVVTGIHRDSGLVAQANWQSWTKILKDLKIHEVKNPHYFEFAERSEKGPDGNPCTDETISGWAIVRAGHFAVGWVETMLVHVNVPDAFLQKIDETMCALTDYPLLDDALLCRLEDEAFEKNWTNFGYADFVRGLDRKFKLSDSIADIRFGNPDKVKEFFHMLTDANGPSDGEGNPNSSEAVERCTRTHLARFLWKLKYSTPPAVSVQPG